MERLRKIKEIIGKSWAFIKDFAILKVNLVETSTENRSRDEYDKKVRFYAFLPEIEEQRDRLEKAYQKTT